MDFNDIESLDFDLHKERVLMAISASESTADGVVFEVKDFLDRCLSEQHRAGRVEALEDLIKSYVAAFGNGSPGAIQLMAAFSHFEISGDRMFQIACDMLRGCMQLASSGAVVDVKLLRLIESAYMRSWVKNSRESEDLSHWRGVYSEISEGGVSAIYAGLDYVERDVAAGRITEALCVAEETANHALLVLDAIHDVESEEEWSLDCRLRYVNIASVVQKLLGFLGVFYRDAKRTEDLVRIRSEMVRFQAQERHFLMLSTDSGSHKTALEISMQGVGELELGNPEEALRRADHALSLLGELPDLGQGCHSRFSALELRSSCLFELGRIEEAIDAEAEVVRLSETAGDWVALSHRCKLAAYHLANGAHEQFRRIIDSVIEEVRGWFKIWKYDPARRSWFFSSEDGGDLGNRPELRCPAQDASRLAACIGVTGQAEAAFDFLMRVAEGNMDLEPSIRYHLAVSLTGESGLTRAPDLERNNCTLLRRLIVEDIELNPGLISRYLCDSRFRWHRHFIEAL